MDANKPDANMAVDGNKPDGNIPVDGNMPDGFVMPDVNMPDMNMPDANLPPAIVQISKPTDFAYIFDAVPDPAGAVVYFTGVDSTGDVGVFSVPVGAGPGAFTKVSTGAPFVSPIGIAISTDGKTLFVADPGTDEGSDRGGIYSVAITGGVAGVISKDTEPRGLTVSNAGGTDEIFFTGTNLASGAHGVYKMSSAGGAATAVAEGGPFVDPSGVTIAANGDIYATDTISAGDHRATVVQIKGGVATAFVSDLYVGYPTGIALVEGDTEVLLSGLDSNTGQDAVTAYTLATMAGTPYVSGAPLTTLNNAAGLHRAAAINTFAFVDNAGNGTDAVYVIK